MLTLHLLRHGATTPETPWRFLGRRDLPLSDLGREQARAWGRVLAGVPFTAAFCSPLSRTRDTAALVLAGRELSAAPLDGLAEIQLGALDGLTKAEAEARFPGQYAARGLDLERFRPPGGESFADVQERAWACLETALDGLSGHVLAVAHAGVNRAVLCRVLGLPLSRLFDLGQDPGCANVLDWSRNPRLVRLNEPAPLPDPAPGADHGTP